MKIPILLNNYLCFVVISIAFFSKILMIFIIVYLGKNAMPIKQRFNKHKYDDPVSSCAEEKLNNELSNVYIDIIDSINMDEELTHFLNHPSNTNTYEPTSQILYLEL
jgi:hypothetical protein